MKFDFEQVSMKIYIKFVMTPIMTLRKEKEESNVA